MEMELTAAEALVVADVLKLVIETGVSMSVLLIGKHLHLKPVFGKAEPWPCVAVSLVIEEQE